MTEIIKHGDRVRLSILEMGMRLWRVDPTFVSARRIAKELGMTHANILYHFKTTDALKNAIAYHAVREGESKVIVHLIASNHKAIATLSEHERRLHFKWASG